MTDEHLERSALDALGARWVAAWAGGGAGLEDCCAPDVQYEDPLTVEPLRGLSEVREHAERLREAFPDIRVEAAGRRLGDPAYACLPWRFLGTHRGAVATLPATGRFVTVHGLHYAELSAGRITRARGFFDLYDVGAQLGVLPARGGLGETALLLLRGFGLRPRA